METRFVFSRGIRAAIVPLIYSALACRDEAAGERRIEAIAATVATAATTDAPSARPSTVTATGGVEARASVDLAFQVPGTLMNVMVDEGERVEAGQVIAVLDPTDYALSFEQAKLTYLAAAEDARRARVMRAADAGIPPEVYDEVMSVESMAKLAAIRAEKRLFDTQLVSPISGILVRRNGDPGEIILAGTTTFTVVDLDVVRVRVAVPQSDVGAVAPGAPARVVVASLGDASFEGRVKLVSPSADSTTHSFAVDIMVANPGHRLRAGMTAHASIDTSSKSNSVASGRVVARAGTGVRRLRRVNEPIIITGVAPTGAEPADAAIGTRRTP